MFDFSVITTWIDQLLRSYMAPWGVILVEGVLVAAALLIVYAVIALVLIYAERKICAFFQCRLGPNRVGPFGLLQPVADMIKILLKELIVIKKSDHFLYELAPFIVIISSVLAFGCIPFGRGLLAIDFNIGVFFIMAVSSIGVLGILLAGWSSNNKFTLIGAMRSGAQMISYELSIGISILTVVVFAGSMQTSQIIAEQQRGWFIFTGHIPMIIAFLIYLIAGTAETNRGPFDLPEAESELTAGYHTEYSGIHFGFYYLAEYLNMFIVSGIAALLFFGGWMPLHISGFESFNAVMDYIPSVFWFFIKSAV
ncbi:MAG: complex I subunit 1 family protein, partial [Bacteroidales bacterium]